MDGRLWVFYSKERLEDRANSRFHGETVTTDEVPKSEGHLFRFAKIKKKRDEAVQETKKISFSLFSRIPTFQFLIILQYSSHLLC